MRQALAWAIALAAIAVAGTASASDPVGIVTSPRAMEFKPDEATATEVVIHGTFSFNKGGAPPAYTYSAPVCGYMYFKCPAGKEDICRMQWKEIKAAIGAAYCSGFASWSTAPTSTVRTEGTPLGTPDPYDLGMGTEGVMGVGDCYTQRTMKCDPPGPSDGGTTDGGTGDTGTPPADTGSTADSGKPTADSGTPSADSGSPAADAAADSGSPAKPADGGTGDSGGCSMGAAPLSVSAWAVGLGFIGLLRRRRSRRT